MQVYIEPSVDTLTGLPDGVVLCGYRHSLRLAHPTRHSAISHAKRAGWELIPNPYEAADLPSPVCEGWDCGDCGDNPVHCPTLKGAS